MSWESVASITGKNKTYILAKIANASLNDGESVTGASISAFDVLTDDSLLKPLIDDVLVIDPTKVTVHYSIPNGTYSYIKLVYKIDSIPTSYTDGTAIDILQSNTYTEVSGIDDGNTYYFVIFTDKSTSEPKPFETTPIYTNCTLVDVAKTLDKDHKQETGWNTSDPYAQISALSQYYGTDYILVCKQSSGNYFNTWSGDEGKGSNTISNGGCIIYIPIIRSNIKNFKMKLKFDSGSADQYAYIEVSLGYIENGEMKTIDNATRLVWTAYTAEWVEKSYTIEQLKKVDYVIISVNKYQWHFKDIKFNYEVE